MTENYGVGGMLRGAQIANLVILSSKLRLR